MARVCRCESLAGYLAQNRVILTLCLGYAVSLLEQPDHVRPVLNIIRQALGTTDACCYRFSVRQCTDTFSLYPFDGDFNATDIGIWCIWQYRKKLVFSPAHMCKRLCIRSIIFAGINSIHALESVACRVVMLAGTSRSYSKRRDIGLEAGPGVEPRYTDLQSAA
jgi:hypothetical protein